MFGPEDVDSSTPVAKTHDLQTLSVRELREYIQKLEAEIERVQQMINQKEAHKTSLSGLFKGE